MTVAEIWDLVDWIVVVFFLFMMLQDVMSWHRTMFRVSMNGIECRKEGFFKSHIVLNAQRMQEVQIKQAIYFKWIGLYSIQIDAAGGSGVELSLHGLSSSQLAELGLDVGIDSDSDAGLLQISSALAYSGQIVAPMLGSAFAVYDFLAKETWKKIPFLRQYLEPIVIKGDGLLHDPYMLVFLSSLFVVMTVLFVCAIAFLWHYPQHLMVDDENLKVSAGSVFKKSIRLQKDRIQMISVTQPIIAKWLGHFNMDIHGAGDSSSTRENVKLLALRPCQVSERLSQMHVKSLDEMKYLPWVRYQDAFFKKRHRNWVIALLFFNVVAATVLTSLDMPLVPLVLLLTVLGALVALKEWLFYEHHGYCLHENDVYIWEGGLIQSWTWVPLKEVDHINAVQSQYFKENSLADVYLKTSNGVVNLRAVPNFEVAHIYQKVLDCSMQSLHSKSNQRRVYA